jgi:hypothetical protein
MNNNPGIRTNAAIAWDGAAATPRNLKNYNDFGWVFETVVDLVADAVFVVQFAPNDETDDCAPGTFVDASENAVCAGPDFVDGAPATFRIPSGTKAGTFCPGTVACREGFWARLRHVSGGANVRAVQLLQGPKRVF